MQREIDFWHDNSGGIGGQWLESVGGASEVSPPGPVSAAASRSTLKSITGPIGAEAMATIQDVARRARVSPATVSRVLNSSSTVHPDLVRRVQAAVEALNYQPNGVARRLRRRESPLWAMIVPDVGNPFFTSMVRGVEDVAQRSGYSVVLCNTDEDTGKEAGYIAAAAEERMAGVIIAAASTRDTDVTPVLDLRIPVVALDRRLRRIAADTVLADNERAAEEATEHLLDMGYRSVACITGPGQAMTAAERLAGYRRALRARGHQLRPSLVRRADFREHGGFEAMASLLADAALDAVFVANNLMTVGALECLIRRDVEVPRQIGVVGFDEIPWASLVRPSLSTVAQPTYEMGKTAGELLTTRLLTPSRPAETVVLRTTLNVRASSTPMATALRNG
jgi:LacI family transcriptional regulator